MTEQFAFHDLVEALMWGFPHELERQAEKCRRKPQAAADVERMSALINLFAALKQVAETTRWANAPTPEHRSLQGNHEHWINPPEDEGLPAFVRGEFQLEIRESKMDGASPWIVSGRSDDYAALLSKSQDNEGTITWNNFPPDGKTIIKPIVAAWQIRRLSDGVLLAASWFEDGDEDDPQKIAPQFWWDCAVCCKEGVLSSGFGFVSLCPDCEGKKGYFRTAPMPSDWMSPCEETVEP